VEQAVTARPRRTGHALVGTMIFLVLSMLLWAASYQQAASQLRVESALRVRTERADRIKKATAWGLDLLETGEPPLTPGLWHRCRVVLDGQTYLVTYLRTDSDPLTYAVDIEWKDPNYDSYPLAPNSFGT
jgi:hypothetical protein